MLSGPNMSKCKELEEPYGTFVTTKMAEKIVPKPQIKQINNKMRNQMDFGPNVSECSTAT